MNEIWKEIPGFAGYEISTFGRIKRLARTMRHPVYPWTTRTYKEKIIKGSYNKENGYHASLKSSEGLDKFVIISRLLLTIFVRPPMDKEVARHLDDDKKNQSLENLCWGTCQENSDDAERNKKIKKGSSRKNSKLNEDQVREIRKLHVFRHPDFGLLGLAKRYSVDSMTIHYVVKRITWRHVD